MPSGSVTKKVALFELPTDGKSQLKRKHAIKRKNNRRASRQFSSVENLVEGLSVDSNKVRNSLISSTLDKSDCVDNESNGLDVNKDCGSNDGADDKKHAKSQPLYGTTKRYDSKTVSLNTVFLFSGSFNALHTLALEEPILPKPQEQQDFLQNSSSGNNVNKLAVWSTGEDLDCIIGERNLRRTVSVDSVLKCRDDSVISDEPFYEELNSIRCSTPAEKATTLPTMPCVQNKVITSPSSISQGSTEPYEFSAIFKDEDDTAPLQTSASYESLYSELVYDNSSIRTTGKDLSLPLPPPPSVYSDIDGSYNNSNSSFDRSSASSYSSKNTRSGEVYGFRTLPPPPAQQTSLVKNPTKIISEAPSKFSSMAKTAGRKIAKKLLSMRRPSQSSFDTDSSIRNKYREQPMMRRASSPCPSVESTATSRKSEPMSVMGSRSSLLPRRSLPGKMPVIMRPPVPPPAPPKSAPPSPPPPTVFVNNINGLQRAPPPPSPQVAPEQTYGHINNNNNAQNNQRVSSDFDDYEDSDFYDSDSELIRNFVSAVQPIYSMEEEPLYQYYTYGISLKPEDDYQPVIPKNLGLTLDLLVPRVGLRTLWCELPEVMSSGILAILSDKQKQWQEAIFEILTSEVSYLKSLDVLISLFYESPELNSLLTEDEMKCVYGNINEVKACSQAFLSELLSKWEESWYIQEIGQTVNDFALNRFSPYIEYCRNKPYQDKMLQKLRITNDDFVSTVKRIEENPKCQMLRMDSFLMLPMQRITRLPLLVNAVIQRTQSLKEKAVCEEALSSLTNLVLECNDAARESQDAEETAAIVEKIEFPRYMKSSVTLGQFVMKNDFMKNPLEGNGQSGGGSQLNWTFRKSKRVLYWLILFSNQLLVTKKKSSGKFEVMEAVPTKDCHIKPLPNIDGVSKDFNHFFMLHFDNRDSVHFLGARSQHEVDRWKQKLDSLRGPTTKSTEKIYQVIFPYDAQRDDELTLEVGEEIKVSQKQPDGWYLGTKVNGGATGWFPGNYCS